MTMTTTTGTGPHFTIRAVLDGFVTAFCSVRDAIGKWQERKQHAAHVSEFSDHLLKDIGLTRSQMFDAVHGRIDFNNTRPQRPHKSGF